MLLGVCNEYRLPHRSASKGDQHDLDTAPAGDREARQKFDIRPSQIISTYEYDAWPPSRH